MKINHIDDKIIGYIKENKIITIPDLQIKFSLSYPKAHEIIDECLRCDVIKYIEGICYEYISKEESKKNLRKEQNEIDEAYRRFERTIFDVIHGEDEIPIRKKLGKKMFDDIADDVFREDCPSERWIALQHGLSPSDAHELIVAYEKIGLLDKIGKNRYRVIPDNTEDLRKILDGKKDEDRTNTLLEKRKEKVEEDGLDDNIFDEDNFDELFNDGFDDDEDEEENNDDEDDFDDEDEELKDATKLPPDELREYVLNRLKRKGLIDQDCEDVDSSNFVYHELYRDKISQLNDISHTALEEKKFVKDIIELADLEKVSIRIIQDKLHTTYHYASTLYDYLLEEGIAIKVEGDESESVMCFDKISAIQYMDKFSENICKRENKFTVEEINKMNNLLFKKYGFKPISSHEGVYYCLDRVRARKYLMIKEEGKMRLSDCCEVFHVLSDRYRSRTYNELVDLIKNNLKSNQLVLDHHFITTALFDFDDIEKMLELLDEEVINIIINA